MLAKVGLAQLDPPYGTAQTIASTHTAGLKGRPTDAHRKLPPEGGTPTLPTRGGGELAAGQAGDDRVRGLRKRRVLHQDTGAAHEIIGETSHHQVVRFFR